MDESRALSALTALAQATRLRAVHLLLQYEPDGLWAGEVGEKLGVRQNLMSVHLAALAEAGLVQRERQSRFIRYRADAQFLEALMHYVAGSHNRPSGEVESDARMPAAQT